MRKPSVIVRDDGVVSRVEVSRYLWDLFTEVGKILRISPLDAFHQMLVLIEDGMRLGSVGALPHMWERARVNLERQGKVGELQGTIPIDLMKLHRSAKTKSGFEGVYSNGKGFRATGKDPATRVGLIHLGTFPSAEDAAWARYVHYTKNKLPYGQLEMALEKTRTESDAMQWSGGDEQKLKHLTIWEAKHLGMQQPIEGLSDEDRALEKIDPYTGKSTP